MPPKKDCELELEDALDDVLAGVLQWKSRLEDGWGPKDEALMRWIEAGPEIVKEKLREREG